ncbi:hypothetical protein AZI86_01860 [Bdellovibrio bacteriovorus]|uniref:Uncharacterized protein n=1 Tax=Bdellovibrio bacteriovorus TaxID=959 RepID=A0A150WMW6_BDEBC|nr:hypothetical protein [Bdellovibrio bacteriovorus]KYG65843.1 hypothetical protein AZI86_01860 [Bdellovibrio bacteriovorus]
MTLLAVLLVSIFGAEITFWLIHKKRLSTVRASSLATLVFCLLTMSLASPLILTLQAGFFGATFVGMTDKSRMGWKRVFIASLVFGLIFYFLIPLANGIGGGLGAAAFVACSIIHLLGQYLPWQKITHHYLR